MGPPFSAIYSETNFSYSTLTRQAEFCLTANRPPPVHDLFGQPATKSTLFG